MFPVRELYLEDILQKIGYSTPEMKKLKQSGGVENVANQSRAEALIHLTQGLNINKGGSGDDQKVTEQDSQSAAVESKKAVYK